MLHRFHPAGERPSAGSRSHDPRPRCRGLGARPRPDARSRPDTPIHFWPSQYTYAQIRQAINARFAPLAGSPAGRSPNGTTQLAIRGEVDYIAATVELFALTRIPNLGPQPPPPAGSYTLRLLDGGGATLQQIPFEPVSWIQSEGEPSHRGAFLLLILTFSVTLG